jgi:hypothetical protein
VKRPRQIDFGSRGKGRFPRVRVTVQGDGWLEVVYMERRSQYAGPERPRVYLHVPPIGARKLMNALRRALPHAERERVARNRRCRKLKLAGVIL